MPDTQLIRDVEVFDAAFTLRRADVRIKGDRVAQLGELSALPGEPLVEGHGALLLPGLQDHHIHLAATAAALTSVSCGPPEVTSAEALQHCLHQAPGDGWLRGVGYHESVAGHIDRQWLDQFGPSRPVRIQHRTGQLWVLNSLALEQLDNASLPKDGRLFNGDELLRSLPRQVPAIEAVSQQLASWGVTGVNDMTVNNDAQTVRWFSELQAEGRLRQKVRVSGSDALSDVLDAARLSVGETKIYLHDHDLPDIDSVIERIRESHQRGRAAAFHCVTEGELVFALSALRDAGASGRDRVEHGSIIPPHLFDLLQALGVTVVTQPNFIAERGDSYLRDVPMNDHPNLYRCRSLQAARIPLAFGTDSPYGHCNPWAAMHAAVRRRTAEGLQMGADDCVTPEVALAGFLGALHAPSEIRQVSTGVPADLCLLTSSWQHCWDDLSAVVVSATWRDGEQIY